MTGEPQWGGWAAWEKGEVPPSTHDGGRGGLVPTAVSWWPRDLPSESDPAGGSQRDLVVLSRGCFLFSLRALSVLWN